MAAIFRPGNTRWRLPGPGSEGGGRQRGPAVREGGVTAPRGVVPSQGEFVVFFKRGSIWGLISSCPPPPTPAFCKGNIFAPLERVYSGGGRRTQI